MLGEIGLLGDSKSTCKPRLYESRQDRRTPLFRFVMEKVTGIG